MKVATDHLGNEYLSVRAMCATYGIKYDTYKQRIKSGWTQEDALTTGLRDCSVKDHMGTLYKSVECMCAAYDINSSVYRYRIRNGWTQEKALTTPNCNNCSCVDHLGNQYVSYTEMAEHYGITCNRLYARLKTGYTLEEALTKPLTNNHGVSCIDHLGNIYKSCEAMCKQYGIDAKTYKSRREDGMSTEAALLTPVDAVCSIYEAVILKYLSDCKLECENQVTLSGCRSLQNKSMPFDFSIANIGLIEVDGEGHFKQVSNWDFLRVVENDTLKTNYCETNNIPLLRIRYDQMQDGTYIDLIEDFLANPKDYIKQHNKFLTEAEYYAERDKNIASISA